MCESCGIESRLVDGVICERCEYVYHSGMEEASFIRQAIISRRLPADMSDPWDTSIVSEELAPMRPHVDAWAQMLGYADPNMVAQMRKKLL